MPRKKRAVPDGFVRAVTIEKLGFQRLKKRFGAGTATIQAWLNECRIRTRNTPNDSLAAYNRKRNEPSAEDWLRMLMSAGNAALVPNFGAQPSQNQTQPQRSQAQPQNPQAHAQTPSRTKKGPKRLLSYEETMELVFSHARSIGDYERWPEIRQRILEVTRQNSTYDERKAFAHLGYGQAFSRLPKRLVQAGMNAFSKWLNWPDCYDTEEPSGSAFLFAWLCDSIDPNWGKAKY